MDGITVVISNTLLYNFIFDWGYNGDDVVQNRITVYFQYRLSAEDDAKIVRKIYNITQEQFNDSGYRASIWKNFESDPDKTIDSFFKQDNPGLIF